MRSVATYALGGLGIYALGVAVTLALGVYTSPQFEWSAGLDWLCG